METTNQSDIPTTDQPLSPIGEYNETAQALANLKHKYDSAVYNVKTPAGYLEATAGRRELRELRVALEHKRKEIKAPVIEQGKLIDAEAARITAQIEALEKPIDVQIRAEDQRRAAEKAERDRIEAERVATIRGRINRIVNEPARLASSPSAEISERLEALRAVELDPANYGEFHEEAVAALAEMLPQLEQLVTRRQQVEAEQAQIEADRAELAKFKAEREERERAENEAREAQRAREDAGAAAAREEADRAARVERERLAAEQAAQAEADRVARAEQLAREEAERAERQAAEDAERDRLRRQAEADAAAAAAERARLEREQLKNITLYDAAMSAREFLVNKGYGDELVTRALTAAIERNE